MAAMVQQEEKKRPNKPVNTTRAFSQTHACLGLRVGVKHARVPRLLHTRRCSVVQATRAVAAAGVAAVAAASQEEEEEEEQQQKQQQEQEQQQQQQQKQQ